MRRWEIKWWEDKKDTQLLWSGHGAFSTWHFSSWNKCGFIGTGQAGHGVKQWVVILQNVDCWGPKTHLSHATRAAGLCRLGFTVCLHCCPGLLLLCMVASEVWDAETKPIEFVCNKGARRAMNIVAEMESALVRIWPASPNFSCSVESSCLSVCLSLPECCHQSISHPHLCSFRHLYTSLAERLYWLHDLLHTSSATLHWASCSILGQHISTLTPAEIENLVFDLIIHKCCGFILPCLCVSLQPQEKRGDIVSSLTLLVESVKAVRASGQPGCAASSLLRLENNMNNYLLILTHLQLNVRGCCLQTKPTYTLVNKQNI